MKHSLLKVKPNQICLLMWHWNQPFSVSGSCRHRSLKRTCRASFVARGCAESSSNTTYSSNSARDTDSSIWDGDDTRLLINPENYNKIYKLWRCYIYTKKIHLYNLYIYIYICNTSNASQYRESNSPYSIQIRNYIRFWVKWGIRRYGWDIMKLC